MARLFLSYVTEDAERVSRLAEDLKASGHDVWFDRWSLKPGERWKDVIAREIQTGDFFIACFSQNTEAKRKSYMNEELIIAIETFRQLQPGEVWLIPVLLDRARVPNFSIGAGEALTSIQWADFSNAWDKGFSQLIAAIGTGPETYIHDSYHYHFDFEGVPKVGQCRVTVTSSLRVLNSIVTKAGTSWDYAPSNVAVETQIVDFEGRTVDTIQHDRLEGPYFEGRIWWWDYFYDETPLRQGQRIKRRSQFLIEDSYASSSCIDSFNAIKHIGSFRWTARFPESRPMKEWSVTLSNAGSSRDFASVVAKGNSGREIAWESNDLILGGIYTLRWAW